MSVAHLIVRIGLIVMLVLGIVVYLATPPRERISAQEGESSPSTATTTPPTTRSDATTSGDLVVVPGVVPVGQTTLAVGLHVLPLDLEVAIEYSGHFVPDGESCNDAGKTGSTPRAVAPTWITLNACTVGDGWVRLVESETSNVLEEVSATVTNTSTVRQQSDASVTVSGVTSSELVPGGSGDSFSVAVAGIESGPEYDLTTVALNGSSAAFNQACSIFTEAEEITKAVTRSYTVYGCIPPGTSIWSYLDLNGVSLASSEFPGPFVNVKDPTVSFSSSTYTVAEGDEVTISVDLSHESHALITVPVTVSNGTAESSDYDVNGLSNDSLTFSDGSTSESFTIEANQDFDDNDETVNLGFGTLPDSVAGTGSHSTATLTIDDDDDTPPPPPTPPAPSGFSATVGGGAWIFLYWDPENGIDDYQIDSRPPDGQWMTVYTGDGDTFGNRLRVRLRLYPCDSSHRIAQDFRIQAYGDGSTYASEWGPHSSADVDMKCPPPVAHTLTVTGQTSIKSMWDLEAGVSQYRVYYRESGSRLEADSDITENNYEVTGLSCGTRYEISLGALGDGSTYAPRWSVFSNRFATTDDCEVTPTDPTVTIEADQTSVTEGDRVEFTVTASHAPSSDLSVTVSVAQIGTFIAGTGTTSVTILANDREASFTVNTVDDNVDEPDGSITVEVEDGTGYDPGSPSSDSVDVEDNDPTPTVSFSSSSYSVAEGSNRRIYVDLSHGAAETSPSQSQCRTIERSPPTTA